MFVFLNRNKIKTRWSNQHPPTTYYQLLTILKQDVTDERQQETSRKAETQIKSKIKSNYLLSDQYSFQERQHYQHIVANSKLHLKPGQ